MLDVFWIRMLGFGVNGLHLVDSHRRALAEAGLDDEGHARHSPRCPHCFYLHPANNTIHVSYICTYVA